ncbi:uncharacterized protein M437DRAFT_39021 [Aureobasidium melanogenum CBS 110374]|uniref:Uncharacterized protein n=1 Tax=Aureobasidium melanogenum (strain CBS 110374) TaxID=1043003 RepID=A0A074W181_AURM1|nr:uncharacterized protein M437DRAFT_39021 [Aureobasidium melanogenum CBS 110374]KEQ66860.1 hypothetical protein M437DRAFT_39021 [Aureobasidium melanogenum CBS 110374]
MSIISKLKGAKKAADDHKAKTEQEPKPATATVPYKHVPTHAATDAMTSSPGGWKAEEIAYQNKARLSRIGSDYSTRPSTSYASTSRSNSRPGFNRANSDSSLDFTSPSPGFSMPGRSTASSMRSAAISRNTSYQGLEKVMESDRDQEPVFAAALLANRSKASRSPRGSTRSSLGKSPLSSVVKLNSDHRRLPMHPLSRFILETESTKCPWGSLSASTLDTTNHPCPKPRKHLRQHLLWSRRRGSPS